MATALGIHSPLLAAVRALTTKAGRRAQGRYAIEGPTLIAEAVAAGCVPVAIYATEAGLGALPRMLDSLACPRYVVSERAMERLTSHVTAPGSLAILRLDLVTLGELFSSGAPVLILAGLADPGNAGTLMRTAEIFGVTRVVFTTEAVEPHNPKVVRGAMGAFFRIQVAIAEHHAVRDEATRHGYAVIGADRAGLPLASFTVPDRFALAVGSERHGLPAGLECELRVAVEQQGAGESLNAAIAGAIVLYSFSQAGRRA